jgi:hypothetical protein
VPPRWFRENLQCATTLWCRDHGTGQTIAIVGRSNIDVQNVRDFRTVLGLPPNDPEIIVNGDDPGQNSDMTEAMERRSDDANAIGEKSGMNDGPFQRSQKWNWAKCWNESPKAATIGNRTRNPHYWDASRRLWRRFKYQPMEAKSNRELLHAFGEAVAICRQSLQKRAMTRIERLYFNQRSECAVRSTAFG